MARNPTNYCSVRIINLFSFSTTDKVDELYSNNKNRNVPGTAIYFTTLSEIRNAISVSRPTWQPMLSRVTGISCKKQEKYENLIAGITARGAVGYILMPFTVIKVRYEVN